MLVWSLSKLTNLLECIIAAQLETHHRFNDLSEPFQSGFFSQHGSGTDLAIFIMLDPIAAFVLGPLFFILGNLIHKHRLHFLCYTDDIQLYIYSQLLLSDRLFPSVKPWMQTNFFQPISSKLDEQDGHGDVVKARLQLPPDYNFTPSVSQLVWNLGIIFDSYLTFEHSINHITKTAFFHLKDLSHL